MSEKNGTSGMVPNLRDHFVIQLFIENIYWECLFVCLSFSLFPTVGCIKGTFQCNSRRVGGSGSLCRPGRDAGRQSGGHQKGIPTGRVAMAP